MRRLFVALLVAGVVLPCAGCLFSVNVRDIPYHRQVVEVDGELYVVDLKTHRARKLEVVWEVPEETTTTTEEVIVED
jgi:hypothetical protein